MGNRFIPKKPPLTPETIVIHTDDGRGVSVNTVTSWSVRYQVVGETVEAIAAGSGFSPAEVAWAIRSHLKHIELPPRDKESLDVLANATD